jgi:hypothetical protein
VADYQPTSKNLAVAASPVERWWPLAVGVVAVGLHAAFLFSYLPDAQGLIGHDYSFFLPMLVNGAQWIAENGLSAVPWFTPGFCGGLPYLPNPEVPFYSLTQALVLALDPITAIRLTAVAFAALGFAGAYLLGRRAFALGVGASLLVATVFLFNETFFHRMFVGHFAWHTLMLGPLVALGIIGDNSPAGGNALARNAIYALGAGIALAVTIEAGSIHVLPPLGLAVAGLIVLCGLRGGNIAAMLVRGIAAAAVAGALTAGRLASSLAFLSLFPRDFYPIAGFDSLGRLFGVLGQAVITGGAPGMSRGMANSQWQLGAHEFGFGLSPIPFLIIAAGLVWVLLRWRRGEVLPAKPTTRQMVLVGALVLVLIVPLALNVYHPAWHAVLKSLPLLKSSSSMLRWLLVYTFVVPVLAGLALQMLPDGKPLKLATLGALAAVVLWQTQASDWPRHAKGAYDPARMTQALADIRAGKLLPPVSATALIRSRDGQRIVMPTWRNDLLADGLSPLTCYAAIFGYRLETLPWRTLNAGPVFQAEDGHFNMFNPSCFVYPAANACKPGDFFAVADKDRLNAFVRYKPMAFERPLKQRIADWVNLIALIVVPLVFAWAVFAAYRRRANRP